MRLIQSFDFNPFSFFFRLVLFYLFCFIYLNAVQLGDIPLRFIFDFFLCLTVVSHLLIYDLSSYYFCLVKHVGDISGYCDMDPSDWSSCSALSLSSQSNLFLS